jgi:TRAP-type mannitol/chloroaromatic compound transport system permease small subunit
MARLPFRAGRGRRMAENSVIARVARVAGDAASYVFLVIALISAYEVVMRYAVGMPTIWVHELSIALAATCFVIGGPYVHQARQHITISFVYERLPSGAQKWVRLLCSLLTLAFLSLLTYAASIQGWQALEYGETTGTALNWPIPAYLKTLFAICAALMTVQTLIHVYEDAVNLRYRGR